jgi:conjugal transfer ATP-binding protein TraC
VRDRLQDAAAGEPRLPDVVRKLNRYSRGGAYGHYFEGEANIALDAPFTVVELSDIKGQAGLEATILQIVMFLGTELMFKTSRSTPTAIVIDEAWDLLKGTGTAAFIEGVVRRARKYTGALITGTQSMQDYKANPAASVCLENSDFRIFLAQKPESIDALQSIDPPVKMLLKSLTSVPGRFSELAIQMPEGFAYGRLLLDPFSLAVFSSKGSTVERMNHYKAQGMSTVEAIKTLVERGEVA